MEFEDNLPQVVVNCQKKLKKKMNMPRAVMDNERDGQMKRKKKEEKRNQRRKEKEKEEREKRKKGRGEIM